MNETSSNRPIKRVKRYRSVNGERRIYKDGLRYKLKDVIELPDGRKVTFVGSGKTRSVCEANTLKLRQKKLRELELVNNSKNTVEDYCLHWIVNVKEPAGLRPNTIAGYKHALNSLITPNIGKTSLTKLTRQDVQELYGKLTRLGKTYFSIKEVRAVLCGALEDAVISGLVPTNVARGVPLPKRPVTRPVHFTAEEVKKVLGRAQQRGDETRWNLAFTLGLRQGECLGLKWDCVEIEGNNAHLKVKRTLTRVQGLGLVLGPVKTQSSDRIIPLSDLQVSMLRRHRSAQKEACLRTGRRFRDDDYVFITVDGTPIDPANDRKAWVSLLREAGVPYRKLHAARHTTATLMHSADTPLLTISKLLGHASIATTAEFYAHVETSSKLKAINQLEEVIA